MKGRMIMRGMFLLILLRGSAAVARADMSVRVDEATQKYTIMDGEKPVLTYNFGTVAVPQRVSGKYAVARSNYVHPLYGANGEILTTDFSKDHPHHRGIYWAWPEVTYKSATRDLHALQGVFARPVKIIKQEGGKKSAIITAENIWKWGDSEPIVREVATITAYPAVNGLRKIDFALSFEALVPGVTIARRGKTKYGGCNFRLSAMTNVKVSKHTDSPGSFPCKAWAELTGTPKDAKEPVGIFILQHPRNPLYPGDWIDFTNLPWLQPTFPSMGTAYELKKGEPLELAYRVIIRSGEGLKSSPEKLFTEYVGDIPDPLAGMAAYKFGENRTILTGIERAARNATDKGRLALEQRILKILKEKESSLDFEKWAFRQLQSCGSAACLSIAAEHLTKESWMQALDAMIAVPGDLSANTMIKVLPALTVERRAAIIQSLGMRRDESAVPTVAKYASGNDTLTALPAVIALGKIGTVSAADQLNTIKVISALEDELVDAKLQCAARLGKTEKAEKIYNEIWSDPTTKSRHRAAALIGVAATSKSAVKEIIPALVSENSYIRNGAAAALNHCDKNSLIKLQDGFDTLPDAARMIVLSAWSKGAVRESEAKIVSQLTDSSTELQLVAIRALRRTGGGASVTPLLKIAAAGDEAGREAKTSLTRLTGRGTFQALAAAVSSNDNKIAKVAIKTITERQDPGCLELMLNITKTADDKLNYLTATALFRLIKNTMPISAQGRELKSILPHIKDADLKKQISSYAAGLGKVNIAKDKAVTSSHPWQAAAKPELAVDGNMNSYWSCAHSPAWISVDLGATEKISSIKVVNYYSDPRFYQYYVEISSDNKSWTKVADMSKNTKHAAKEGTLHQFKPTTTRYVRVTMLKNSANPGMHIVELEVYGSM